MAVWRTKACDIFGFAANHHSFARGKVELFADLLQLVSQSSDEPETLDRSAEYVTWATKQTSDELASAVDLAFLPLMFRYARICKLLNHRFSTDLLTAKLLNTIKCDMAIHRWLPICNLTGNAVQNMSLNRRRFPLASGP